MVGNSLGGLGLLFPLAFFALYALVVIGVGVLVIRLGLRPLQEEVRACTQQLAAVLASQRQPSNDPGGYGPPPGTPSR